MRTVMQGGCLLIVVLGCVLWPVAQTDAQDWGDRSEYEWQTVDAGGKDLPSWGTSSTSTTTISAPAFVPFVPGTSYSYYTAGYWTRSGGDQYLGASIQLPTGALVTALEVEGCDSDPSGDVRVWLSDCLWSNTTGCPGVPSGGAGSTGTPGCYYWYQPISPGKTIANSSHSYYVTLQLGASGLNNRVRAVRVYYELQVSPSPASATFADVPIGHPFFQYVEALAASGITAGCGGGNFCPDATLSRGQMAVFLAKALGLHYPW